MLKWLAEKLFVLAAWLDWDEPEPPKKKRGRPVGSKDRKPRISKKIGRPKGSKDKAPRNSTNMGRPRGSKNKPKVQP